MKRERDITFDILKGFGIILMVTAHTLGWRNNLSHFICSFHIPLFFIVSGYFYKKQPLLIQLKKDFKRLVIPYLFITLVEIVLIAFHTLISIHQLDVPINLIWDSISPIWFLLALFSAKVIFNLIVIHHYVMLSFIVSSISVFLTFRYNIIIPFSLSSATGSLFFFSIGFYIKESNKKEKIRQYSYILIPIAIILWINTSVNGLVDTYKNTYKLWVLDYAGAISGVYLLYFISFYIAQKKGIICMILNKTGFYSIVLLAFHSIDYIFPQWLQFTSVFGKDNAIPLILICRFIFLYFSVLVSKKIYILRRIFLL